MCLIEQERILSIRYCDISTYVDFSVPFRIFCPLTSVRLLLASVTDLK
jgi:hypothetical protein